MEEDEIQAQPCKFPRVGNCRNDSDKIGSSRDIEELEDGDQLRRNSTNRFHNWHHTNSRIIRVSRASGGKDRHSKVMTSKGLRDRRVRLSVTTAIQFYDLQDRLGYDQPSKAVEWLIKAAADAISELPSLNTTFPDTPKQPSDEKKRESEQGFDDSADAELDGETNFNHHQQNQNQSQNLSLSKSACSSTSETSKGSGLSLSRSEIRVNRVKARERARERAAKEKEKESESGIAHHHHQNNVNNNPMSQTASFTELLTAGTCSPSGSVHQNHSTMEMDYFSSGLLLGPSSSSRAHHQSSSSSSGLISAGQIQLGNSLSLPQVSVSTFNNNVCGDHQNHSSDLHLQQHFSFIPDHQLIPAHVVTSGSDYNLNFTISSSNSGLAGYNNRGTLQSNSPPSLNFPHHLQRYSPIDGSSNVPFVIGAAAPTTMDNNNHHHHHHQFSPIFDGRLQLCYGDGTRHSDHKGKAKN